MPQVPAPLDKEKSRFLRGMDAAKAIQDPVERAWSILDVHRDLYNCAQGAIDYIQDSKNPQVLALLTDTPSRVDDRLFGLQLDLGYAANVAKIKYDAVIEKNRKAKELLGGLWCSRFDQEFYDANSDYVDADREYTRVTKSIRHVINGSDRAMNCQYDPNISIMENFIAAGEWIMKKEQQTLQEFGPRPEVPLPF